MRVRYRLVLLMIALSIATILAVGPIRTWDTLTLRTTEDWQRPDGVRNRTRARLWSKPGFVEFFESWYPDGTKRYEGTAHDWNANWAGYAKWWTEQGELVTYCVWAEGEPQHGVFEMYTHYFEDGPTGLVESRPPTRKQTRYLDSTAVETRTSPPWFSEEEILRSMESFKP